MSTPPRNSLAAAAVLFSGLASAVVLLGAPAPAAADPTYETYAPRIFVEAPSEVAVGATTRISVLAIDTWGPEGPHVGTVGVGHVVRLEVTTTDDSADLNPHHLIDAEGHGYITFDVVFHTPGLHDVAVMTGTGESGRSNPIRVFETAPTEPVYWGDLHGHLHTPGNGHDGYLPADEWASYLYEGLEFARLASRLDFAAFTPHLQTAGGLARPDSASVTPWDLLLDEVDRAHRPGKFVVFPGFEWQGNEGDHTVLYPDTIALEAPASFGELARSVRERGGLLSAHAIYLPSEFNFHTDALICVEVTRDSKSMEHFGLDAMHNGVAATFLGCSDTHGGALGATSLTGLRAATLTRQGVLDAIRAGKTWATNGERIVLDVTVDDTGPLPKVTARGVGTASVDRVEFYRNGRLVHDARNFGDGMEFEAVFEDADLLHPECIAGPVAYHVRVVQSTPNRYDPSRRDIAVSSPREHEITVAQFDEAHARKATVTVLEGPGSALVRMRRAWAALHIAEAGGLRVRPRDDQSIVGWNRNELAEVSSAARALNGLATKDPTLLRVAGFALAIPRVAEALGVVEDARSRVRGLSADTLRDVIRKAQERVAVAEAALSPTDRAQLDLVWFAGDALRDRSRRLLDEAAEALRRDLGVSWTAQSAQPRASWDLTTDPRLWAQFESVSAHAIKQRSEFQDRWGYTRPNPAPAERAAARVRIATQGDASGARLTDPADSTWSASFERRRDGWVATIPASRVRRPGDAPLRITFDPPLQVTRVFLEGPDGERLERSGRVTRFSVRRDDGLLSASITVEGRPVVAELQQTGLFGPETIWSGRLAVGPHALAFPTKSNASGVVVLKWGFAGWKRTASHPLDGHEFARPSGFGVLEDGRAVIALTDSMIVVDPVSNFTWSFIYPDERRHEFGREFCVAELPDGRVVIRGSDGPGGGWVSAIDPLSAAWDSVAAGPETGTVVVAANGELAWLTGRSLTRRSAGGTETASPLDVTGRLLGVAGAGYPIVRLPTGEAVRLGSNGEVTGRISGPVLAADRSGGVLSLAGLDARHQELALAIRLARTLPDGTVVGPFTLDVRTLPTGEPVHVAIAADGALLILGGTTWWRRQPDHDWWGAVVERWEPVWAGESSS